MDRSLGVDVSERQRAIVLEHNVRWNLLADYLAENPASHAVHWP
jgi:hypothetical protein